MSCSPLTVHVSFLAKWVFYTVMFVLYRSSEKCFIFTVLLCSGGKDKKGSGAESSGAPLVFVPNGKESRMKDEEKMKTLKWNFASPRAEFIDQLKEQLQPCTSAALFTQLFHDDFKQHIAALGILTKVSCGNGLQEV